MTQNNIKVYTKTKYPVYIVSKGRAEKSLTARFMEKDGLDFRIVIEPQERDAYAKHWGDDRLLLLPFSNLGLGSIPARNWIWEHSISEGHPWHWIFDDNCRSVYRRYKQRRIYCNSIIAIKAIEEFVDRYENIAIAGMNYKMFCPDNKAYPAYHLNCHVYSNLLIRNDLPFRWRGRYNEDTDLCLQVLTAGWCTIQTNAFLLDKMQTMTMKGGNSDSLYQGDGRLVMAKSLERAWPGVVETRRRFQRPQHVIKGAWRYFDTQLRKKPEYVLTEKLKTENEKGIKLIVKKEIKSHKLKKIVDEYHKKER